VRNFNNSEIKLLEKAQINLFPSIQASSWFADFITRIRNKFFFQPANRFSSPRAVNESYSREVVTNCIPTVWLVGFDIPDLNTKDSAGIHS
jgi:hypothetical protein